MTIKEFYAQIGEDDQDVVKRLGSEALIRRLILKFPQDETFAVLQEALEQQIRKPPFVRRIHSRVWLSIWALRGFTMRRRH